MDIDSRDTRGLDDESDIDQEKLVDREIAKFKNLLILETIEDNQDLHVFEISYKAAAISNYLKDLPTYHDVLKYYLNSHVKTIKKTSLVAQLNVPTELCQIIGIYSMHKYIPKIRKVTAEIFTLIVAYLEYHKDNPPQEIHKPIRSVDMKRIVSAWDADFINTFESDKRTLCMIIFGANFLGIDSLLELGTAKIATLIKDKTPAEITSILN